MNLGTLIDRAHYLISQDPTASTNYVTDEMMQNFANEGVRMMCELGKVWECQNTITLVKDTPSYAFPTEDALTSTPCEVVDVYDVLYEGESLTYMNPKDRGKIFVVGSTPLWWYLFGERIWIHPTPSYSEASDTCDVLFYGVPSTEMSDAAHTPPFPSKHHHKLLPFMAGRAKQTLNRHDEAATFFTEFANSMGIDLGELKRRLGVV